MKITILDYGMGNLHSAAKALSVVGADVLISREPKDIARADKLLLPGVGAMQACMAGMQVVGADELVKKAVFNKPVMAICVGMQALFETSEENGGSDCLGILAGQVRRFDEMWQHAGAAIKIPHMGWNAVTPSEYHQQHPLWRGIDVGAYFYFVHSYYCVPSDGGIVAASCDYGREFCASIIHENLFATQFHPEKSHRAGLQLLKNFVDWRI